MSLSLVSESILLVGGQLHYWPDFIGEEERVEMFTRLRAATPWLQSRIRIAGREVAIPRLNAWYAEGGASYGYSGIRLPGHPLTPLLRGLKERVEDLTERPFNSALLNLYRTGADSVGWHSDNESELGESPQIASLSLGEPRRFELRPMNSQVGGVVGMTLAGGSLLLMAGDLQQHWRHRLPKAPSAHGERINITFRWVHNGS